EFRRVLFRSYHVAPVEVVLNEAVALDPHALRTLAAREQGERKDLPHLVGRKGISFDRDEVLVACPGEFRLVQQVELLPDQPIEEARQGIVIPVPKPRLRKALELCPSMLLRVVVSSSQANRMFARDVLAVGNI